MTTTSARRCAATLISPSYSSRAFSPSYHPLSSSSSSQSESPRSYGMASVSAQGKSCG
ncbi:hypothetical protein CaCOL14_012527 [Colletotrichum acutatum]